MEKTKKVGSEITVRISLTFQEAPDVHTLLAMTPVRARGKLVRLALERYIQETGHVAGNLDTQIAAISDWLRSRNDAPEQISHSPNLSVQDLPFAQVAKKRSDANIHVNNLNRIPTIANDALGETAPKAEQPNISESASIKRWLAS